MKQVLALTTGLTVATVHTELENVQWQLKQGLDLLVAL